MTPYIILLICTCFISFFAQYHKSKKNIGEMKLMFYLNFVILVLFAGLRSSSVGTDTSNYELIFSNKNSIYDFFSNANYEYSFYSLNWLVKQFTSDFNTLLIAIALIVVFSYQKVIYKYSNNYWLSNFVYITLGFYSFFFNGVRQGMACALVFLALSFLLERNFKKYLLLIILAASFHKTAILLLPLYFLFNVDKLKGKGTYIFVIGLLSSLVMSFAIDIMSNIDARYTYYGKSEHTGGELIVSFITILGALFYILRNKIKLYKKEYDLMLVIYLFGVMISVVSTLLKLDPSGILRFNQYFIHTAIIIIPILYSNIKLKTNRIIFVLILLPIFTTYFYIYTNKIGELAPYSLV
jgi:hypothetical protein